MDKVEQLRRQAVRYFRNGEKLFKRGRREKASELLWGSVALSLKALGEKRGWKHDSHRSLDEIAWRLDQEQKDSGIYGDFNIAESLHRNFYNLEMNDAQVRRRSRRVHWLVRRLQKL